MKNSRQFFSAVTVCTVLSLATSAPVMATSLYSITDLGTLGGSWSQVIGFNDAGQVIGNSETTSGNSHNFLWSESSGMSDLDPLISDPLKNLLNQSSMSDRFYNGYFWVRVPSPLPYPPTSGGELCNSSASCSVSLTPTVIGNSGEVLGYWQLTSTSFRESGMFFMNQGGQVYNLGSFNGFVETYNRRRATGEWVFKIPPQIVCFNNPYNGYPGSPGQHQFLSSCVSPSGSSEVVYYGGNLSSTTSSWGYRGDANNFYMNDAGQVFGYKTTASGENHAFLWSESEGMRDLGNLGSNWVNPNDLGNLGSDWRNTSIDSIGPNGVRVGSSYDSYGNPRAALWENDVMTDLNNLIPSESGWYLLEAKSINQTGQIVGDGLINGQKHAFLLTPVSQTSSVPEPASTFGLLALGASGVNAVLKHKRPKKIGG